MTEFVDSRGDRWVIEVTTGAIMDLAKRAGISLVAKQTAERMQVDMCFALQVAGEFIADQAVSRGLTHEAVIGRMSFAEVSEFLSVFAEEFALYFTPVKDSDSKKAS
jgi:hypothetical protein